MIKNLAVFVSMLLFTCNAAQAYPKTWHKLSECLAHEVSLSGRLRPEFSKNVERFFDRYVDYEQLVYIDKDGDTILDFIASNANGVMKKLSRQVLNKDRTLQLASEHLVYHVILRLKKLSYFDLCRVLQASLQGRYNVMNTLTDKGLIAARSRIMYFLIEQLDGFSEMSSQPAGKLPSLERLTQYALGAPGMMRSMDYELHELSKPLARSWEDIVYFDDFYERELLRLQSVSFLTQVIAISKGLPAGGL